MAILGDRLKWAIKQGDTEPVIRLQIRNKSNGAPVNLTGATCTFHMMNSAGVLVIDAAASIESPATDGIVYYTWQAGDTDVAGKFDAEFLLESLPSGGELRAPNNDQIEILITEQLG